MNKIDELIQQLCPEGIEYLPLWKVTAWDKKFNGVEKQFQSKIISYPYVLAKVFDEIEDTSGNVLLLATGVSKEKRWTTEEKAGTNLCEGEIVAIPWGGTPNVKYYNGKFVTADNRIATSLDTSILNNKFLYYCLCNGLEQIAKMYRGSGIQHPSMKEVLNFTIPLPPLSIQSVIVSILDKFTTLEVELEARLEMEKNCRLRQYKYYRDKLLCFENDNNVEWKNLKSLCKIMNGKDYKLLNEGNIPVYGSGGIMTYVDTAAHDGISILLPRKGSIGNIFYVDEPFWTVDTVYWTQINEELINPKFLYHYLKTINFKSMNQAVGAVPSMTQAQYYKINVPIPPLEEQSRIANILDRFEALTTSISEGLPAEIAARKQQYEYYRNKLLTFNRKAV